MTSGDYVLSQQGVEVGMGPERKVTVLGRMLDNTCDKRERDKILDRLLSLVDGL